MQFYLIAIHRQIFDDEYQYVRTFTDAVSFVEVTSLRKTPTRYYIDELERMAKESVMLFWDCPCFQGRGEGNYEKQSQDDLFFSKYSDR